MAAIPVKRLADAKSRLALRLSAAERAELVLTLAARTVQVVKASGLVARIAVVTPEPDLGERLGVTTLLDHGDLNSSLDKAVEWAVTIGARGLLILPGDLPLLTSNDLHALLSAQPASIAIAATGDGGTGALYLTPPDSISPSFGAGSFQRHVQMATDRGVAVWRIQREGLAFDLDTPNDLARTRTLGDLSALEFT